MERRHVRNLDFPLILTTLGLVGFGLIVVYSATYTLADAGGDPYFFLKRQGVWSVVGALAMVAVLTLDYGVYRKWTRVLYLGTIAMLAVVMVVAPAVAGAERWLVIGPFRLQPSELAKIAIIITLAKQLESKTNLHTVRGLVAPLLHVSVPMALILLQPDLGTALVFSGIVLGMLFFAGARPVHLLVMVLLGVAVVSGAAYLSTSGMLPLLKDYQVRRLTVFLDPYADRMGAGWNVIQSMVAIGSGSFFGKGLFAGSQTQLNFLPARHTDFIFSVVGEEFGFLGASLLLAAFVFFLWRLMRAVVLAKDQFGRLLVAGITSMVLFHLVVNVGMTLGVMPITGLPLPFISYGGSSLLANMVAVGIVLNVLIHRRKLQF